MIIPFKLRVEHFIIAVLTVMLLFEGCKGDPAPVVITKAVKEKTVQTVNSEKNTEIKNTVPEKIQVIETPGKIQRIKNPKDLSELERKKVKAVFRYLDTTSLPGALIFTETLSEGRILEKTVTAKVDHKETTITETVVNQPTGLFISPGLSFSPLGGVEEAESSLMLIRGNIGASVGAYYNFRNNSPGFKLKIHLKI